MKPSKLGLVTVPLYISGVIYLLVAVVVIVAYPFISSMLASMPEATADSEVPLEMVKNMLVVVIIFAAVVSLAIGVFAIITAKKLAERKYWAWISALVLAVLYIPSIFIVLGVPMLIGLLDKELMEWAKSEQ